MRVVYLMPGEDVDCGIAEIVCDYVTIPGDGRIVECYKNPIRCVAKIDTYRVAWIES